MDPSKANHLQLGKSSLSGLEKSISDAVLSAGAIDDYIYSPATNQTVGRDDIISLSYTKAWTENGIAMTKELYYEYYPIEPVNGVYSEFDEILIGHSVGVNLGSFTVREENDYGEYTDYTYSDVKVENIIKDNSSETVEDGDTVFVSYTLRFDAKQWFNEEINNFELPEGYSAINIDYDGFYKQTVMYDQVIATANRYDDDYGYDYSYENETLESMIVGKLLGSTTSSFTVTNANVGENIVDIKYSNVKINQIVKSELNPITVKYTPYTDDEKKTERNNTGETIPLNNVELTYYVFPVYYSNTPDISAEVILNNFITTVTGETNDGRYILDVFNDNGYSYNGKSVTELVKEYMILYYAYENICANSVNYEKALFTAQSNLAKHVGYSESERATLIAKMQKIHAQMLEQNQKELSAEASLNKAISDILSCTKNGVSIEIELVEDFKEYVSNLLN